MSTARYALAVTASYTLLEPEPVVEGKAPPAPAGNDKARPQRRPRARTLSSGFAAQRRPRYALADFAFENKPTQLALRAWLRAVDQVRRRMDCPTTMQEIVRLSEKCQSADEVDRGHGQRAGPDRDVEASMDRAERRPPGRRQRGPSPCRQPADRSRQRLPAGSGGGCWGGRLHRRMCRLPRKAQMTIKSMPCRRRCCGWDGSGTV